MKRFSARWRLRFALVAVLFATTSPAAAQTVQVREGTVEGLTLPSGVRAWLGVPFAAPPVRELRWVAPQPAKPWIGTYHADRFMPMCLQALRSRTMNHYFGNEATSEDCLYLNIWSPPNAQKLPVVVWIYGGGFNVGSASMANYSGETLAQDGVVRVNLAYRVGPMGFLAHPDLSRESGYGASGNYGLMDQIAGLRWVRDNIAAFGGDPDNVTIVGQSAGSMSVSLLQASPEAKGLFHKVVGMSGSAFGDMIRPASLAKAEGEGVALQGVLKVSSIEEMRDIAGDRILAAAAGVPRSSMVADGKYVPASAEEVFAARRQSDVPVLVGFTRDEAFGSLPPARTVEEFQAAVRSRYPAAADRILAAYPVRSDAEVARARADIARDASTGLQAALWAEAQTEYGEAPAYAFLFARRQPYTAGITFADHDPATAGAYHTGDVPYWLRTREAMNLFRRTRDWEPVDEQLEADMAGALVAFAKTGKPSSPRVPLWPQFDPDHPSLVWLGEQVRTLDWPNFATLELLAGPAPAPPAAPRTTPRD